MDPVSHEVLRFDRFVLDLRRGCLRTGEQDIDLRPKAFRLLTYLAANAGRLVPKQELIEAVWPNVVVSDESLVQSVRQLRRSLGDDDHRLIKTVPRRGYRFDVTTSAGEVAVHAVPRAREISQADQAGSSALPVSDRPSVAVLPFANLSGDPAHEYFADAIVEDIITELSKFGELFVIARNSSFQYKGKAVDVRQVGRELGVRYVLEGSVQRGGGRVRIAAQLIDAETRRHRWAERYDRELQDTFAIKDEVARNIVAILAAHVNRAEAERTVLKPPATWEAYDFCVRARATMASYLSSLAGDAARAIEVGRTYARPDPFYPAFATGYLGLAHFVAKDYAEAARLLRECVARAPNNRAAHEWLAAASAQMGQLERARFHAGEVLRIQPGWTIEGSAKAVAAFRFPQDAEHLFEGFRKAGLPER